MDFSFSHLWSSMGIFAKLIVLTMGLMSTASLLVMFERIVVYMRSGSESVQFAEKMAKVLAGGDVAAAAASGLTKNVGHLGRTINAGLTAFRTAPANKDVAIESVARAMERQAAREVQNLKRGLGILATVASTAPFIGLLGTTMGIVNSFQQMAATGSGGLGTISGGISEALITTAFGLLVAIPAVMAFNFLQGWVDARSVDLSESSNEFLDVVTRHFAK
ncbi:MotA/TolQ/ExbB proton channel family protein [Archangium sp.]|uniref:MotA/TolQ/ExbB proton channel family protein n=1 Tax=Archangium sp. TaxID=1872627 RepID=UPI00286D207D|nr:MotA/TolQ/ExbB proton channel family protein [Archangium sp.]